MRTRQREDADVGGRRPAEWPESTVEMDDEAFALAIAEGRRVKSSA